MDAVPYMICHPIRWQIIRGAVRIRKLYGSLHVRLQLRFDLRLCKPQRLFRRPRTQHSASQSSTSLFAAWSSCFVSFLGFGARFGVPMVSCVFFFYFFILFLQTFCSSSLLAFRAFVSFSLYILVYQGPLLSHFLGVAPYTFTIWCIHQPYPAIRVCHKFDLKRRTFSIAIRIFQSL